MPQDSWLPLSLSLHPLQSVDSIMTTGKGRMVSYRLARHRHPVHGHGHGQRCRSVRMTADQDELQRIMLKVIQTRKALLKQVVTNPVQGTAIPTIQIRALMTILQLPVLKKMRAMVTRKKNRPLVQIMAAMTRMQTQAIHPPQRSS